MRHRFIWLCLLLLAIPPATLAATLSGRVVSVHDGDTITVLDDANNKHKVRLAGVDAPELKQPFGQASRKHLSNLVAGKSVTVEWSKRDKYGRVVGKVHEGGADVGLAQIRAGMAWHYVKYASEQPAEDRNAYAKAEHEARLRHLGLWAEQRQTPPWDYRATVANKVERTNDGGTSEGRTRN